MQEHRSRRDFLRLAGAGALAAVAVGAACDSRSGEPKRAASAPAKTKAPKTLRIAQWSHFVPAYDAWFDNEYTKRWGEDHDVEVVVDHIPFAELVARAGTEVTAQRGHDIVGFVSPPSGFEDHVIDHREIVTEVEAKLGPMTPLVERSILNPKTGKYFGFSDYWAVDPVNYRADLWNQVEPGLVPDTWEDVLRAGPELKGMGHPLGISMSAEIDGNLGLMALMHAFGASLQDEEAKLTVNRPAAVEAVKMGAALYQAGMTDEVFGWDSASNNRYLASGTGSLILNAISALRAVEGQQPGLAANIALAPAPAGPAARLGLAHLVGVYVVWNFSENQEMAQQFLVDFALDSREAFIRSGFYNTPSFPKAVPDLDALVAADPAQPAGKYTLISGASRWSTNIGHPGNANAAVDEVFQQFLVPRMFAAAARDELSAEDAVARAEAEMQPIFARWRERGKI